jgi:anti-sigma regulatory factor (Ser/Thr protein kinase)
MDSIDASRLRLCLDEAIQNAISHGNADDPRKPVKVSAYRVGGGWEVVVRDQGRGFKLKDVPDPRHPQSLEKEGGRGLLILTEYMDRVQYYEGGRTLVLTRLSGQRAAF